MEPMIEDSALVLHHAEQQRASIAPLSETYHATFTHLGEVSIRLA
jgi:hypothetical protein